jgi:hypothetical protein
MLTTEMAITRGMMMLWTRMMTMLTRTTDKLRDYSRSPGWRRGRERSDRSWPGGGGGLPPLVPPRRVGGGDNGNKDAKNKRWAESMGMDIKEGRGEKTTTLYKRGHLGLKEDGVRMHRKGKKKDKKDKK